MQLTMNVPACIAAVLAVLGATTGCGRTQSATSIPAPSAIGRTEKAWLDDTRPRFDGVGPRPLAVQVWYRS